MMALARDRFRLATVLVAAQFPETVPEARMLRAWLDRWAGLGDIVTGMNRQGFDARRSRFPFGWRPSIALASEPDAEVGRAGGCSRALAGGAVGGARHTAARRGPVR